MLSCWLFIAFALLIRAAAATDPTISCPSSGTVVDPNAVIPTNDGGAGQRHLYFADGFYHFYLLAEWNCPIPGDMFLCVPTLPYVRRVQQYDGSFHYFTTLGAPFLGAAVFDVDPLYTGAAPTPGRPDIPFAWCQANGDAVGCEAYDSFALTDKTEVFFDLSTVVCDVYGNIADTDRNCGDLTLPEQPAVPCPTSLTSCVWSTDPQDGLAWPTQRDLYFEDGSYRFWYSLSTYYYFSFVVDPTYAGVPRTGEGAAFSECAVDGTAVSCTAYDPVACTASTESFDLSNVTCTLSGMFYAPGWTCAASSAPLDPPYGTSCDVVACVLTEDGESASHTATVSAGETTHVTGCCSTPSDCPEPEAIGSTSLRSWCNFTVPPYGPLAPDVVLGTCQAVEIDCSAAACLYYDVLADGMPCNTWCFEGCPDAQHYFPAVLAEMARGIADPFAVADQLFGPCIPQCVQCVLPYVNEITYDPVVSERACSVFG